MQRVPIRCIRSTERDAASTEFNCAPCNKIRMHSTRHWLPWQRLQRLHGQQVCLKLVNGRGNCLFSAPLLSTRAARRSSSAALLQDDGTGWMERRMQIAEKWSKKLLISKTVPRSLRTKSAHFYELSNQFGFFRPTEAVEIF
jgi:hypothetical protein